MKNCSTVPVILVLISVSPLMGSAERPHIGVDQRVELLSVVFRLAGNPEYNQGRVPKYETAIESHFGGFRDHEAIRAARALRESNGVSFDAVMSMAIHLSDTSRLSERLPFTRPGIMLDQRWGGTGARPFMTSLRRFATDARFAAFTESQRQLYATTNERLRSFVERRVDFKWFSSFYQTSPKAQFVLVPGLANGGASYGPRFVGTNGAEEFWSIVGVDTVDGDGLPLFDDSMVPTVLHEFSHSFVNPTMAKHAARLEPAGSMIYSGVAGLMQRRAYGNWKTMLDESIVRAAVARYVLAHEGPDKARKELQQQWSQGFLWIDELFELLGAYERERERYANLEAFMPRIAQYFDALPPRVPSMLKQYESTRPRLVSMVPVPDDGLTLAGRA
jgi:hypothetical protein